MQHQPHLFQQPTKHLGPSLPGGLHPAVAPTDPDSKLANFIRKGDANTEALDLIAALPRPDYRKVFRELLTEMYRGVQAINRTQIAHIHDQVFDGIVLPEQNVTAVSSEHQQVIDQWKRILSLVDPILPQGQTENHRLSQGRNVTRKALAEAIHDTFRDKAETSPAGAIALGMIGVLLTYAEERAVQYTNALALDMDDSSAKQEVEAMRRAIDLLTTKFYPNNDRASDVFDRAKYLTEPGSTIERVAPAVQRPRLRTRDRR